MTDPGAQAIGAGQGAVIVARGLSRRFRAVRALSEVDLDVPAGACFALLGPNGAGKSTTVRIACGLLRPDEGEISVLGLDPFRSPDPLRHRVGLVPDFPTVYDVLTPRENLTRFARLRRLGEQDAAKRIEELAALLALEDELDQCTSALSRGAQRKVMLAAALLHAPAVLFLDEPFEGIDPLASRNIRIVLGELRQRGVTVFLTSHLLPIVETIASHAAILVNGRVTTCGPLASLLEQHGSLERAVLAATGAAPATPRLDWYTTAWAG
ncbi:MAG: ABC transporter ATP-binding protein [Acidobacteriota bacterium]|nr:MAG: ABC transporter ATP-binding protein [Acidobacteriota bacterium]